VSARPATWVVLAAAVALAGCSFIYDWDAEIRAGIDAAPPSARDAAPPAADAACATCGPDAGVNRSGCADGEREAFVDVAAQPAIAGCAGGFTVPGLLNEAAPSCNRLAGDDSAAPGGAGCNASDLCAAGWHVCRTPAEVAAASSSGTCAGAVPANAPAQFFAIRQSGPGSADCGEGANDIFGCGTLGIAPGNTCAPLDRFSNDQCIELAAPWSCGDDNIAEALNVTKPGPAAGGVLCCRD